MDTTGHHSIAEVGEDLLKAAIRASNPHQPDMRVGAFYMGNWLTDVSQAVDPVAYRNAVSGVQDLKVDELFNRMIADAPAWVRWTVDSGRGQVLYTQLLRNLEQAKTRLESSLHHLLDGGRSGNLATGFREMFRIVGYAKFVLDDQGQPVAMDEASYFEVFEDRFTQYYPHEHLDRPETGSGVYATQKSQRPLNDRTDVVDASGDLYTYLRADIKVASGLLAYLDGGTENPCLKPSWAVGTFHAEQAEFADQDGNLQLVRDDNPAWNKHLAMLGHALHAVEDFFAHSTFVEHTSASLPDSYRRFSRLEDSSILARRLKEWRTGFDDGTDNWTALRNDTHIATGYFDTFDTLVSLSHALEKLLDRPHGTVGQDADAAMEYKYGKLLTDTLSFVDDPRATWTANDPSRDGYDADNANIAVKWLREQQQDDLQLITQQDPSLNRLIGLMLGHPLLANQPPQIKAAFRRAIKTMGSTYGSGRLAVTLFGALKDVAGFLHSPLEWLRDWVGDTVYDYLKEKGEVYLRNLIYEYLGSQRIGCHSLLAKDSGPELFHDAAMDCAKTVHWYVVRTLTRHAFHPSSTRVCRSGDATDTRTALAQHEWIDWLELVEYFLGHPFTQLETRLSATDVAGNVIHTTRSDGSAMSPDSLATLASRYAQNHIAMPGGPPALTWEIIADANFPTEGLSTAERQRKINEVLSHQPDAAVMTRDRVNYAFKPGLPLTIPYQRVSIPQRSGAAVSRAWWYRVITAGWQQGRALHGHQRIPIDHASQLRLVQEASQERQRLERAYR